ncbi:MAG: LysR substrate-binding domain-containing protein [Litorimonas sp.]
MNLRQFQYVLAVAEHLHFTKAAKALNVSQPALSQTIQAFELEFGVRLFDRSAHAIRVTEAGKIVIDHARQAMSTTNALRDALEAYRGLRRGMIHVGVLQTFSALYLPEIIQEFIQQHPNIDIEVAALSNDEIHNKISLGEIDLGVGFKKNDVVTQMHELYSDDLVFVCHPNHAFAAHGSLSLSRIAEERIALLSQSYSTRRDIDNLFSNQGVVMNKVITFNTFSSIMTAVNSGTCVSITPANAKRVSPALNLYFGKLKPKPPKRKICLIRGGHGLRTPASDAFAETIMRYFRND